MTNLFDWSATPDSNGTVGGVNIAEGCQAANLNNGLRNAMAEVAKYVADAGGALTSGGSSNAYTLTTNASVTALAAGMMFAFKANHTNTGAATLAVDGLTGKDIKRGDGSALTAGDINSGGIYLVAYEASATVFYLINTPLAGVLTTTGGSWAAEVTVASATTADVLGAASYFVAVSGTTTITSLGTGASRIRFVRFTGALTLTHNATSLILPGGANITTAAGDTCIVVSDGSSNARVVNYQRAVNLSVTAVKQQVFTSTGTYTPSSGMLYAIIECVGGGGGGGSSVIANVNYNFGGAGGGGGGYSRKRVTASDVGTSQSVTIGAGGAGGSGSSGSGANSGSNGGDTSVGTLCIAKGGAGGAPGYVSNINTGGGGAGGVAGTGDVTAVGGDGGVGAYQSGSGSTIFGPSGSGGNSVFGGGASGVQANGGATAGKAGKAYGGGGSGAATNASASASASGGAGAAGVVIVTEFCSG